MVFSLQLSHVWGMLVLQPIWLLGSSFFYFLKARARTSNFCRERRA